MKSQSQTFSRKNIFVPRLYDEGISTIWAIAHFSTVGKKRRIELSNAVVEQDSNVKRELIDVPSGLMNEFPAISIREQSTGYRIE